MTSSWREAVAPYHEGWSEPHRTRMLEALAEENDFGESLGFTCEPDKRRGYGWCSFSQGVVYIWSCGEYWARAKLIDGMYQHHLYYHTLQQALRNNCPFAKLGDLGTKEYLEDEEAAELAQQLYWGDDEGVQTSAD